MMRVTGRLAQAGPSSVPLHCVPLGMAAPREWAFCDLKSGCIRELCHSILSNSLEDLKSPWRGGSYITSSSTRMDIPCSTRMEPLKPGVAYVWIHPLPLHLSALHALTWSTFGQGKGTRLSSALHLHAPAPRIYSVIVGNLLPMLHWAPQ